VVAGVLSGTSADGIDVALARPGPDRGPGLLAFETLSFEPDLHARVRAVLDDEPTGLREVALLHRDLGRAFGEAVSRVARDHGRAVELVDSHGQTVYHHDGEEPTGAATLQLGDGDLVAACARAPVVSDFRQADVAAGGEGAPLSALVEEELFPTLSRPAAVLNLGGIGNVTLLPAPGGALAAFDTGPANCLLDGLARRFLGRPWDEGGRAALAGRAHGGFVAELLRHPFFDRAPPRSTGRDTFGEGWVESVCELARRRGLVGTGGAPVDLFASAAAFVAETVAVALERFAAAAPSVLVVAGGGARNRALVAALASRSGADVRESDAWGVPVDAREALAFALLAARNLLGCASTDPGATGARRGVVLGKLSSPAGLAGALAVR